LRKPKEFRHAYNEGERFKGRFMTAFIVPSETSFHRIGVTASIKAIGNSVKRSRAKRLLREAFRLSSNELAVLGTKYDWAINARGYILKVKSEKVVTEFREIIKNVEAKEINLRRPSNVK
jgi:ribonuclease P protein component